MTTFRIMVAGLVGAVIGWLTAPAIGYIGACILAFAAGIIVDFYITKE